MQKFDLTGGICVGATQAIGRKFERQEVGNDVMVKTGIKKGQIKMNFPIFLIKTLESANSLEDWASIALSDNSSKRFILWKA